MIDHDTLLFHKRPSSFLTLYKLYKGFRSGKHRVKVGETIPRLEAQWYDIKLNQNDVDKFTDICGIERKSVIPVLYPFTLIYPVNLRLISQKEVPIPMLKMLTIRNTTTMYRSIQVDEKLDVISRITGQQFVPKGMEFYIQSVLKAKGEMVWENYSTIYVPGKNQKKIDDYSPPRFEQIPDAEVFARWYLSAKDRFRFARVMGDSNGIHYSPRYARLFGFKRDFAQPIRIASKCLDFMSNRTEILSNKIDLMFKGPVYYERELTMKSTFMDSNHRFDLYCQDNDRPCISGNLSL